MGCENKEAEMKEDELGEEEGGHCGLSSPDV